MIYPIGIQTFEKIVKDGFVYVDKTDLIYSLVTQGQIYFLSRPRRFGKSLLLSTLRAYFEGKKELFAGLKIDALEHDWHVHRVFHFDFNGVDFTMPGALHLKIEGYLYDWEEEFGISSGVDTNLGSRFNRILQAAAEQTGRGAVVLVDEYDKPLLDVLEKDPELLEQNREILKAFYSVFKLADASLRFVFLTGVTKFSQVSVFSGFNQPKDISMFDKYEALCGITEEELHTQFAEPIREMAASEGCTEEEMRQRLKRHYDGYHFSKEMTDIYNPFSVLNAFFSKEFGNYWFQTGTPTFLVELLKESDYDLRLLMDGIETAASAFTEYRADRKNPIPLIYQSGYLTIKEYDREFGLYRLGFPNDEVRYGFLNFLVPFYTAITDEERSFYVGKFVQELRSGDVDAFMRRFEAFFADFPYELNDRTERHYQVVIYLIFKLMGQFCDAKVRGAKGRADAVVKTKDYIYVFEFKLDGSVKDALRQIDEKGYLLPYEADGRELVKIGVSFSKEDRNLGCWEIV